MLRTSFGQILLMLAVGAGMLGLSACSSTPDWVDSTDIFYTEDDMLFFRGEVRGVYDLALGKRQAEADAKKRLVEKVETAATVEFREMLRGANAYPGDVGRFAEDLFESEADVAISGMTAIKSYWQEMPEDAVQTGDAVPLHVFALVGIPKKDFEAAKARAVDAMLEQSRHDQNATVEQLLEERKRRQ